MAKEKKGLTAKEETLNQIIEAQRQKIKVLEDYGKKLKKELKNIKEDYNVTCKDIEENYKKELKDQYEMQQNLLVMAVIGAIILGIGIGFIV